MHHCISYPVRKADGLWCKFQELYRKKKSTGDPDCPLSVKRVKLLRRAIIEMCEVEDAEAEEVVQGAGDMEQEANAAAALWVDPMRVTLSQIGGKHKKADEDP
jgi:hypothetical protein